LNTHLTSLTQEQPDSKIVCLVCQGFVVVSDTHWSVVHQSYTIVTSSNKSTDCSHPHSLTSRSDS